MASIERRSGSWRVYWRLGGRGGVKQSTTWPSDAENLAQQAARIAEAHRHRITADEVYTAILGASDEPDLPPATPTVREWSQTWLEQHTAGISPETRDDYRVLVRLRILPKLGHRRLADIDRDLVTTWISEQCRQVSASTVRKAHAVLTSMLSAAVPLHIPENPAASTGRRGSSGLPTIERKEMTCLEPAESRLVVASAVPSIRDLVEVTLATGLRLGEAVAMQIGDVTITRRDGRTRTALQVQRALKRHGRVGPPKSRASIRSIPVTGAAEETVQRLVESAGRRTRSLLFPAPAGGMWSKDNLRERHWKPTVTEAQRCAEHPPPPPVRVHKTGPVARDRRSVSTCDCGTRLHKTPRFHDLRHTHASYLIAAGWDMLALQKRMGHASIAITLGTYGHLLDHGQDERLAALDALMAG